MCLTESNLLQLTYSGRPLVMNKKSYKS